MFSCDYLELDSDYVFQVQAPLDLSFVFENSGVH